MARSLKSVAARGDNVAGMIDGAKLAVYRDRIAALMKQQKEIGDEIKDVAMDCVDAGVASIPEIKGLARESLKNQEVVRDHLDRMDALRQALDAFAARLGERPAAPAEEEAPRQRRRRDNTIRFGAARQRLSSDIDPPLGPWEDPPAAA